MTTRAYWDQVYREKGPHNVSWFQPHAERSFRFIRSANISRDSPIIDVGGGASRLVDDLVVDGYRNVTVLDISGAALDIAKERLGPAANRVTWLEADVLTTQLPTRHFGLWHDRAVFHFLTEEHKRRAYVDVVLGSVVAGGHVIIATFAEDGPTKCSGLPVVRYSPDELHTVFGSHFSLLCHEREDHYTPFGTIQKFMYCYCRVANEEDESNE